MPLGEQNFKSRWGSGLAHVDASTIVRLRFALAGIFFLYWPSKSHCAFVNVLNFGRSSNHTTMARFGASEEIHRLSDTCLQIFSGCYLRLRA
jgi:hypothetical protein